MGAFTRKLPSSRWNRLSTSMRSSKPVRSEGVPCWYPLLHKLEQKLAAMNKDRDRRTDAGTNQTRPDLRDRTRTPLQLAHHRDTAGDFTRRTLPHRASRMGIGHHLDDGDYDSLAVFRGDHTP